MRISDWSSDVCSSDLATCPCVATKDVGYAVAVEIIGPRKEPGNRSDGCPERRNDRHRLIQAAHVVRLVRNAGGPAQVGDVRIGEVADRELVRSEEHTSELQSLMRISYAVFCLKKKKLIQDQH